MSQPAADIGMIGLGVMGRNLGMNLADCGFTVAGYDRDAPTSQSWINEYADHVGESGRERLIACADVGALVGGLKRPRVIVVLVPAGAAVDAVCASLIEADIEPDDVVVDAGNSRWTDTIRRVNEYAGKLVFFGSGISGGAVGARTGPSLMPGGDREAWARLRPLWEAIAARVDPDTGRELPRKPGEAPLPGGEPCAAYIGADGAGHYVKMVHNGIEYADMQLIAEAYDLMRRGLDMPPHKVADVFAEWNQGELDSYLVEITADILRQDDPRTGGPLIDVILDAAKMKGTGTWTAMSALDLGVPAMTITEAVYARGMSGLKEERTNSPSLSGRGPGGGSKGEDDSQVSRRARTTPQPDPPPNLPPERGEGLLIAIRDALYCSKIVAFAQGFQLMRAAAGEYGWSLDYGSIARIWRGGCIIRARLLREIVAAYEREPALPNLLCDPSLRTEIEARQQGWRDVVAWAVHRGIPVPAMSSALAYRDAYHTAVLPANLIQAQRDYFGSHTYERTDHERGRSFHLEWSGDRAEREVR